MFCTVETKRKPLNSLKFRGFHLFAVILRGATGNRTRDTRIFSPLLYQLSYGTIGFGTANVGLIFGLPKLFYHFSLLPSSFVSSQLYEHFQNIYSSHPSCQVQGHRHLFCPGRACPGDQDRVEGRCDAWIQEVQGVRRGDYPYAPLRYRQDQEYHRHRHRDIGIAGGYKILAHHL